MHSTKQAASSGGLDWGRALPIFVLVFVDILGLTIIIPLLHLYAAVYGASPLEIGLVAAAFPLAQLVGVPVMGALSDRFGRKPLLLISQVTTCISFVILALAGSLWVVILSRVLDGLFGANIATAQAALTDITDDEHRAQGLGLIGAAFGLGFVFGPLIAFVALEFQDSLALPALIAAVYSFMSILLTLFMFKETLPEDERSAGKGTGITPFIVVQMLRRPQINILLVLMFLQQVVFFGFEALLGLFLLTRLGLLGQGSALMFLYVGVILVTVQGRFMGKWSRKYGERRLVLGALVLISAGLLLLATTPLQPHIFYVRELAEKDLASHIPGSAEALVGGISLTLPANENRGLIGVLWALAGLLPLSLGSGLIRPALNSLMTKWAGRDEYGRVLGVSASFVSAANACAPLIGGLIFQTYGATTPFLMGGLMMAALVVMAFMVVKMPEGIPQTANVPQ